MYRDVEVDPLSEAVERQTTTTRHSFLKNLPQFLSIGSGIFILLSGGINISSVFASYTLDEFFVDVVPLKVSWFIGAICGAIFAALLFNKVQTKFILILASLLTTAGGIICCSDNIIGIAVSRYINGVANGLVMVPTLILSGEESVKTLRGRISSISSIMSFPSGIAIQFYFFIDQRHGLILFQNLGIITIICGILSFILATCCAVESPFYFLTLGDEVKAFDALIKLQRQPIDILEAQQRLAEHKQYIEENAGKDFRECLSSNSLTLLNMCIYRAITALLFTLYVFDGIQHSTDLFLESVSTWPYWMVTMFYAFGVLIGMYTNDNVGRRLTGLTGISVCAVVYIGIGTIHKYSMNSYSQSGIKAVLWMLIFSQFFAGLFITTTTTYLTEAFPLNIKPFCITVAFTVEMLMQIVLFSPFPDHSQLYFIILGIVLLKFAFYSFYYLPETKNMTLREAGLQFKRIVLI